MNAGHHKTLSLCPKGNLILTDAVTVTDTPGTGSNGSGNEPQSSESPSSQSRNGGNIFDSTGGGGSDSGHLSSSGPSVSGKLSNKSFPTPPRLGSYKPFNVKPSSCDFFYLIYFSQGIIECTLF